ncbi:alpha/beta hydrolase [Halovenus marina]|uniref:alpha/beta hydrolase n=1 Tax=Halovenus marina TaxID=3396621 RepID=UPI003F55254D
MTADLPPLDPELATALEEIPDHYLPKNLFDFDDIPGTRKRVTEIYEAVFDEPPESKRVESEEVTIPGPTENQTIRLRIHRPVDSTGPLPCVYWLHGGGMVVGGVQKEDATAHRLVENLNCVVVVVEYRLVPEHPYPAPVNDCYTGLKWLGNNAEELSVDDTRIAIAGSSAGGGLAAAVALRVRDEGGPDTCLQMLLSPMLDDRNTTESSKQVTDIGMWDREMNIRAWEAYLGDQRGEDNIPPYAAPGRVEDLSGLPPAFLDIGTHDVFRDETAAYAGRLAKDGVQTEYHLWPGACHGYTTFVPDAQLSEETWTVRMNALQRAFAE